MLLQTSRYLSSDVNETINYTRRNNNNINSIKLLENVTTKEKLLLQTDIFST